MTPTIIAVDLGGTQIRAAPCDASGQIYKRVARLTKAAEGPEAVLARINETITEAVEGTGLDAVAGIGIGAPGPLDPLRHDPGRAQPARLGQRAAAQPGQRALRQTHFPRQRCQCRRAGRVDLRRRPRACSDMIYLTISTGIGSGIIIDGRMLLGARGLAAEAGHTIIKPDGPKCGCGNRGCVEAFAAGPAISRDVVGRLKAGKSSKILEDGRRRPGQGGCPRGQRSGRARATSWP